MKDTALRAAVLVFLMIIPGETAAGVQDDVTVSLAGLVAQESDVPILEPEFSLFRGAVTVLAGRASAPPFPSESYKWVIESARNVGMKAEKLGLTAPLDRGEQYGVLISDLIAAQEYGSLRPLRRAIDRDFVPPDLVPAK